MASDRHVLSRTVRTAAHRALAARDCLLQGYPDWQAWRSQARAMKTEAIDHLDELIAQLARKVENWGGEVLFARDAAAARKLILNIAQKHRVKRVVKSKSMTTEEISLNPDLTAAGLEVAETDLGEFIIQLAGHAPAHLTAPALHLNRQQIARIFEKHLGLSCPADPILLCRNASSYLKSRYAEAQMGITGINFAAAAEGTLVCLENEGNLRLTAAMPAVHLALMGLEKVIPTLLNLEVLLRLLPASATGQRLTALVHFFHGLKNGPAGPQAFYLIILDNGRRRLAADPELRETLYCLRCGACLNICPVFQAGGAHLYGRVYPGAIGIPLARYLAPLGDISDLCTQCGACGEICPAAIELPEKILTVRQESPRFRAMRNLSWGAGLVFAHPRLYRPLASGFRHIEGKFPHISLKKFVGVDVAPESFHRRHLQPMSETGVSPAPFPPTPGPQVEQPPRTATEQAPDIRPSSPHLSPESCFQEAGSTLHHIRGSGALARFLADRTVGTLWLEDHPWLRPVARTLKDHGLEVQVAEDYWAPEADTVVTIGLGAIPELGTVLLGAESGAASWLPLRARKQVVIVPEDQAHLSFSEALDLTRRREPGQVTWLTGPTRTTDIEKVLVLGAQGPAELAIVAYRAKS